MPIGDWTADARTLAAAYLEFHMPTFALAYNGSGAVNGTAFPFSVSMVGTPLSPNVVNFFCFRLLFFCFGLLLFWWTTFYPPGDDYRGRSPSHGGRLTCSQNNSTSFNPKRP